MPHALVTGAAGFIGSHVCDALLRAGHDVIGLDDLSGGTRENLPEDVRFYCGNVGDVSLVRSLFRDHSIQYVFHLAAYAAEGLSHFVRRFTYDNNLTATMTVLDEAINAGTVKCFVFTSSIAVYGDCPPPFDEEIAPTPLDPYGIAKFAVELDLQAARNLFGLRSIIFRLHNVYGERQNLADPYRNVIGIFMNQILSNQPMTIFGDGSQTRAFTYIGDVAPAIAASIDIPACYDQVFNLGSDTVSSVRDLAELTARVMGVPADIRHLDARAEVDHAFARHDRMRRLLPAHHPQISLVEGLERMANWARTHAPSPSWLPPIEVQRGLPGSWKEVAALAPASQSR